MQLMTIKQVNEICEKIAKENGFIITCPIVENGRLTKTLGQVKYEDGFGIKKIEFSKKFLQFGTEAQIMDTIKHELAHAFVYWTTGELHGHDKIWQDIAKRLGANPKAIAEGQFYEGLPEKINKYTIYCKKCGKLIGARDKACNITKYPELYSSKCCKSFIKIQQNW